MKNYFFNLVTCFHCEKKLEVFFAFGVSNYMYCVQLQCNLTYYEQNDCDLKIKTSIRK